MYDAVEDPYTYEGSTVLKNLLDLREAEALHAFEAEISTQRATEPLPAGNFSRITARYITIVPRRLRLGWKTTHRAHLEGRQSVLLS
jgi:hypothetical protein